jgi:transcriptional regulator with XRE-family HTH domain
MSPGRASAIEAALERMGELGLTQDALAKRARVDITTVNRFLQGHKWPQVRTRAQLETALGWPVGTLGRIATGRETVDIRRLEAAKQRLLAALAASDAETMREAVADAYAELSSAVDRPDPGAGHPSSGRVPQ